MNDDRPAPEQLLARIKTEAAEPSRRGRLKVFFGFAAGVGKTYAMLQAARAEAAQGADVLLGYIEPHARPETASLTLGLDILPARKVEYRGVFLREFDLDAALQRKPRLLLVDELAHTNAPGSRHAKRWQDVDELLEAGIDVWTTLNVQHVESLNDIVAQITGVVVRETIPDAVFDRADEVELIDLPPDDLLERLREGKVYVSTQAAKAMERFFKKANLIALREIAMRRTADRINAEVQTARLGETRTQTWPTRERLLVCVGPSPSSAKVIRTARRMASALRAPWIAVTTESPARPLGERERAQVAQHLNLAEQLGAETATVNGSDVAAEILNYAMARNVTKIVIGKTTGRPWWQFWKKPIVDRLLAKSGDIDVYVIHGAMDAKPVPADPPQVSPPADPSGYLWATGAMAAASFVAWLFQQAGISEANVVMVFLLAVVVVSVFQGRGPSIFAAVVATLLFDFFFIPPFLSFAVADTQYVFTLLVTLLVAMVISTLMSRVREHAAIGRERERRTGALLRLTRALAGLSCRLQLAASAEHQLAEILDFEAAVLLPNENKQMAAATSRGAQFDTPSERAVAQWVFEHGRAAGAGTDTLPAAAALYLPLPSPEGAMGVLAVRPAASSSWTGPDKRQFLEAIASQIGLALARDWLADETQRVLAQAEAERLRSSLLSSVSHDLRTPLSAIAGAASSLLSQNDLPGSTRQELLESIGLEAHRLSRLVENLLHMTRMEAGVVEVQKTWQPLEEVVETALARLDAVLGGRPIATDLPAGLPLVPLDGQLIEQVLVNLLENAAKYSPEGTPVTLAVREGDHEVSVQVGDRGPGLAAGELERVFDKFFRGSNAGSRRGAGLGLAIAKAIVQAHGGKIWATNRDGGGAEFTFTLPIEGAPPEVHAAPLDAATQQA